MRIKPFRSFILISMRNIRIPHLGIVELHLVLLTVKRWWKDEGWQGGGRGRE